MKLNNSRYFIEFNFKKVHLMNKRVSSLTFLTFTFILTSCATPSESQLLALNYGHAPKNYKEIFENGVKSGLKDPKSAQIRNVKEPKKFWSKDLYRGLTPFWLICGELNAKNSFGAYVGYELAAVWFQNGNFGRLNMIQGELMGNLVKERNPCN